VGIVWVQAYPAPGRYGAVGPPGAPRVAGSQGFVVSLPAMHMLASSGSSAFAINGFAGLTGAQQLSFWLAFILFNGYVMLEVVCLASFYFAARPRSGSPNPAAIWYFIASLWVVMAFITTVWAAPAEKAFLDDSGTFIAVGTRTVKVFIGLGFAAIAVMCLLIGVVETSRRKRTSRRTLVI
jgi:hypothetical protein